MCAVLSRLNVGSNLSGLLIQLKRETSFMEKVHQALLA